MNPWPPRTSTVGTASREDMPDDGMPDDGMADEDEAGAEVTGVEAENGIRAR